MTQQRAYDSSVNSAEDSLAIVIYDMLREALLSDCWASIQRTTMLIESNHNAMHNPVLVHVCMTT